MKTIFLLLVLALTCLHAQSQTLLIVDKSTLQPIQYAQIEAAGSLLTTDTKGKVDVSKINANQSFTIRQIGYQPITLSATQLKALNYQVLMTEKAFDLNEVVVSASKFEERQRDVAQQVQVLRSKELQFMSQPTSAEVLQQSGNVLVQKSQLGGGSPIMRGFEANKILLVIDGVRLNNAIFRGGHLQNVLRMDNGILDKTEIVFGPGSTVYGSDALGGVIHFHTKTPTFNATKVNAFARYGSAMSEKTGHVDVNLGSGKLASLTSFTYSDFDDLRQGNNRSTEFPEFGKQLYYVERENGADVVKTNANPNIQKFSGYQQWDFLQKFRYQANEKTTHLLNFQYSNSSDIPRYDRLTELASGKPRWAQWYYGPEKRMLLSYQLQLSKSSFYDEARITAALQDIGESRYQRRLNAATLQKRLEAVKVYSLNADFQKKIGTNEVRYGIEVTHNDVNSTANQTNLSTGAVTGLDTRYPDGGATMRTLAAYVTNTREFSEKFITNFGIRLTNTDMQATFVEKTFFPFPFSNANQNSTAFTPSLGLIYMPTQNWRFTLTAASGFRVPNVDDLTKVFESVAGTLNVPNPNLKPEKTVNFDLGVSKIFADKIRIEAVGFYTNLNDAITTKPFTLNGQSQVQYNGKLSNVVASQNANKAYIYGYSLQLQGDLSPVLAIAGSLNYTYGRIKTDTTDYPFDHVAPLFGKVSTKLNLNHFKAELFVLFSGEKSLKDFNLIGEDNFVYATPQGMPAWSTFNIRTSYQLTKPLQIQLNIENLFDKNYRVFASGLSSPGRNVVVTVRASI